MKSTGEQLSFAAGLSRGSNVMSKQKERSWSELTRSEQLASRLYPRLTPKDRQAQMAEQARKDGKRPPYTNGQMGGVAKKGR
jgi:hypothetical protein